MEFYASNPDELMHYGVLGMRWGVHRSKASKRRAAKTRALKSELKKARSEADSAKAELAKREAASIHPSKKTVKDMTDDDLSRAIRRLQMEKQYADLTKPAEKKKIFDGRQFVASVMEQSAKKLATEALNYAGGTAINRVVGKPVINVKEINKDDKKKDN